MKLKITVHGVAYEVDVEVLDAGEGFPPPRKTRSMMPTEGNASEHGNNIAMKSVKPVAASTGSKEGISSPIAGTIIEIKCSNGQSVTKGQILVIMEAMKMKTSIAAPTDGQIKKVLIAAGDTVRENQMLIELE
ncbi:MAG: biotin/lipoyl-containing protein [Candidatus Zixiibacteriota bacterium]